MRFLPQEGQAVAALTSLLSAASEFVQMLRYILYICIYVHIRRVYLNGIYLSIYLYVLKSGPGNGRISEGPSSDGRLRRHTQGFKASGMGGCRV